MSAEVSYSISALPVSVVGLTELEEVRVALESYVDGKVDSIHSLDPRTQAWLEEQLQTYGAGQLIEALERLVTDAPVIELELAVVPTDEWREKLVIWFRHQVSPVVLIRLHARRNLVAGLRVRTGKHVYDMSLATRLQTATGNMQEDRKSVV